MKKLAILSLALALLMAFGSMPALAERMTDEGTPRNQTLIIDPMGGKTGNPFQMNPYMQGTTMDNGLHQTGYEHLWEIDTQNGVQIPYLAAEMPVANEDFTKFTFKLREGVKWSDGEDFNADDVVFTYDMLMKYKDSIGQGATLATVVTSMTKIGDYEIAVETARPFPRLSQRLGVTIWGNGFYIVPEHIWKDVDPTSFADPNPVTTGPYTIKDRDPQGMWFLWEKRPDWQNSVTGILYGEPQPQYVMWKSYGTEEKRLMAMINHDIDILCDIMPESWDVLQAQDPTAAAWLDEFPYGAFDDPCERGILFNAAKPPFDKAEVRWAMALALDIKQVAISSFRGQLRVSPIQMPPTGALMEAYHKPMTEWLTSYAFEDGYQPFDPNYAKDIVEMLTAQGITGLPTDPQEQIDIFGVGWWKYDPEKATELLLKNGLELIDGKWHFEGKPWSFTINVPADFEVQSMLLGFSCADAWRKFGIDVEAVKLESSAFSAGDSLGTFEAGAYWPACGIIPDFFNNISGWHQKFLTPLGEPNVGPASRQGYQSISDGLDKMEAIASDDPRIVEYGTEVMKAFVEEMPFVQMFGTSKIVPSDNYYWTNYPTAKNNYEGPWWWWSTFKVCLPRITPTGAQ